MKSKKEYWEQYYKNNREKIKKHNRQWYKNNSKKCKKKHKQWCKDNPEKVKELRKQWNKNNPNYHRLKYQEKKEYIDNYKLSKGCKGCGYNKCAAALDFHHPNNDKEFNISGNMSKNLKKIEEEVKKCEVLCANCHRELHKKEEEIE